MDAWVAIVLIVTVAAVTPGPNNFIVLGAATRGSFISAGPVIVGVLAGSLVLLLIIAAGAGAAFEAEPRLRMALTLVGSFYLAWLGAKLIWGGVVNANAAAPEGGALPVTGIGVAGFQLANPKSWLLVTTAVAALPQDPSFALSLVALAAILTVVSTACLTLWALAGAVAAQWLATPPARRLFDGVMGAALVASAALLLQAVSSS
jgi:threonine/homoserine/homoserine lactone efflux protein